MMAGIEFDNLPVLGKGFNELAELAERDRGWNATCALIIEAIQEQGADHG